MYQGSGLFGLPASASLAFSSSLEPPWPVLDPLGANLRSSWTQLGTILGPTWPSLGPTWPGLGPSWASFGPIWGQFPRAGAALARLGPTWGKFGVTLDPTWCHAEANLAQLGAILGARLAPVPTTSVRYRSTYACMALRMMLRSGHVLPITANTDGQTLAKCRDRADHR